MNPKDPTRSVDLIRNIVADEIAEEYGQLYQHDKSEMTLLFVQKGETPWHRLLERLQINPPAPSKLVGMTFQRALEIDRTIRDDDPGFWAET